MPHLARWLGLSLALSVACDTGYTIDITVTVPDDVAAAYTPENRGILMVTLNTDDGSSRRAVTVLCGDAASFEVDLGGEGERKEGIVRAWIEPGTDAPAAWSPTWASAATPAATATSPPPAPPSTPPAAASRTTPPSSSSSPPRSAPAPLTTDRVVHRVTDHHGDSKQYSAAG